MNAVLDLYGNRYGRLTVIGRDEIKSSPSRKHVAWKCQCDCGTVLTVRAASLKSGNTKSCGCMAAESKQSRRSPRFGHEEEYVIWTGIKQRCFNKNSQAYSRYGGRGISMCERWKSSFSNFLADIGKRPSKSHSVDRINNDGDYEPNNCRWATDYEQSRNTRVNRFVEINGEIKTVTDWIDSLDVSASLVYKKMKTMPDSQALLQSKRTRNVSKRICL